ncbi:MAG: M56 family metallopeptidase [Sphingobacteriales bacterium]
MPALFTFLFKVNIALVLFCLGYYLVLRHLTFYTLNRVYLVTAILFSSIYPWINLNGFFERHHQLTGSVQTVIMHWRAPAENLVKPLNQPNYWQWAEVIFWVGAALLATRLVMQLISLYRLYKSSEPGNVHNYAVRLIEGDVSPFSFWRSIYVNPAKLSPSDLEKVLEHEHIHVSEWHTLDILLAELSTIFYWFNPGIWLMKKAVRENVEFITDRKILQKGVDTKQYQYSLLSVSLAGKSNSLVNNFNMSTIKKRIIMMNTKRSSRLNLSRYMFVAPAVIILLLIFSISKADVAKKHIANTLKSLTTAIKSVAISNDDRPIMHPASKQPVKVVAANVKIKLNATLKNADTIYAGKSKDGKRTMLVTNSKGLDSIAYVINGAKSSRADLLALDPAKVYSIEMMSAADAKQFVDFTLDKPEILFATTDDSETGKKLKARIDKTMRSGVLAATINKANGDLAPRATAMAYSESSQNTSSDVAPAVVSYSVSNSASISSDDAPAAVASNFGNSSGVTLVVTDSKVKTAANSVVYVTGKPVTNVRITGTNLAPVVRLNGLELDTVKVKGIGKKNIVYLNKVRINDETTLDSPGNKLIIVDGKEVKSLKNVSADDIKSLTVLKNETAEKRYGDKGKNGVIIITTKKSQ